MFGFPFDSKNIEVLRSFGCRIDEEKLENTLWPKRQTILDDTALVVVHFGGRSEARENAARRGLRWMIESQSYVPQVYFIELTHGEDPVFCEGLPPGVNYTHIDGGPESADLFNKEALYNYAINYLLGDEQAIIFADSDMIPLSSMYWAKYSDKIKTNPGAMIQGFSAWCDEKQGRIQPSLGMYEESGKSLNHYAPGLVWGVHRDFIDYWCGKMGTKEFFNIWGITGSGDCFLIFEHARREQYGAQYDRHYELPYWRDVERTGGEVAEIMYLDEPLLHWYHGNFRDRAYEWSRRCLAPFGDVRQYVRLGKKGVLEWIDPIGSPLRKVVKRKPELQDRASTEAVIAAAISMEGFAGSTDGRHPEPPRSKSRRPISSRIGDVARGIRAALAMLALAAILSGCATQCPAATEASWEGYQGHSSEKTEVQK